MFTNALLSGLALAYTVSASPVLPRSGCPSYLIINTRGTFEQQGPSIATTSMNQQIQAAVSGGSIYYTVYPAGADQQSGAATTDIVNQINNGLASNPNQCFVLEGYSQGAAATVNAMPMLTGAAFNAVKAVILLGDPFHKAGLSSNVDENGGTTTSNDNGISAYQNVQIPSNWVSKTRDVCYKGDGICDTQDGGINFQHLMYGSSTTVQQQSANYVIQRLQ
ncbi:hypothetical protein AMS68_005461 [Peltaster fructicola]|uniref:Cutinase n=1 Tax=Peltaster fructicola TaxID=286661 RepID=A0A6H0XYW9_9PEZI|nr:hypothetical protein AMS68_005461 [Peltaster fructicola]